MLVVAFLTSWSRSIGAIRALYASEGCPNDEGDGLLPCFERKEKAEAACDEEEYNRAKVDP